MDYSYYRIITTPVMIVITVHDTDEIGVPPQASVFSDDDWGVMVSAAGGEQSLLDALEITEVHDAT